MRARAPDGSRWAVRRRWLQWRPRMKQALASPRGHQDVPLDRLAHQGQLGLPPRALVAPNPSGQVLGLLERILLLVLLPLTLLGRALRLTAWTVVVRREHERWTELSVVGWAASRRLAAGTADAIEQGRPPQRTVAPAGVGPGSPDVGSPGWDAFG